MKDCKALIIAASEEVRLNLSSMVSETGLSDITVSDGKNVRAICDRDSFGLVILAFPLEDSFGLDTASFLEKAEAEAEIMLLCPAKVFEEVSTRKAKSGSAVLPKNLARPVMVSLIRTAAARKQRSDELREDNKMLRDMINEVKLVNRAKCVLIEYLRISEREAHRQIQKRAMDQRITLTEAATDILKTYDYNGRKD